ncbi:MAG: PilW family protein [Natronospirillum sp.]
MKKLISGSQRAKAQRLGGQYRRLSTRQSQGLSLLEMLVALALGVVVLAGAFNLFIGTSRTFGVNENLSRMQEDARFALNVLERDVKMSGFRGCSPIFNNNLDLPANSLEMRLYLNDALLGWEYENTAPADTLTLDAAALAPNAMAYTNGTGDSLHDQLVDIVLAGSDVVILNRTNRVEAPLNGNPDTVNLSRIGLAVNSNVPQGALMLVVDDHCAQADLFQKTNEANQPEVIAVTGSGLNPDNVSSGYNFEIQNDARLYQVRSTAYYLGLGTDDQPALFLKNLDMPNQHAVELVQGVETMQILYGITNAANSTQTTAYVTADQVTNWNNVLSVRLALLLRSTQTANNHTNRRLYNLSGTQINPTGGEFDNPDGDQNLRILVTKTVGLRNRLR